MLLPQLLEYERRLPYSGQIDVQVGDFVTETQVVGHQDYIPGKMTRFDAAKALAIPPSELRDAMVVSEGDRVETGTPVAASYRFAERRAALAPCKGYLGLVSRNLGYVFIREPIPLGQKEPVTLDVVQELGIWPIAFRDSLKVQLGSLVVPEQVIAAKKAGLKSVFVQSPIYGKVVEIANGKVTIKPLHVRTELQAYLAGRVTAVDPGQAVRIQALAYVVHGAYGVGGESGGELLLAVTDPGQTLSAHDVNDTWCNRVVVAGRTADVDLLRAAQEAGAAALVLGHLSAPVLLEYMGSKTLMGITGDEDVDTTLVLTEGFLPSPIGARSWELLRALKDRYASVNGTTHIRAGVIRPEVIVCEREWPAEMVSVRAEAVDIAPGDRVRLIREPMRGAVGTVVELPATRQTISTGSTVRVAVVQVGGRKMTVPVANLSLVPEQA